MNEISFKRFDESQKEEVEVLFSMFPDRISMVSNQENDTLPVLRFVVPLKMPNSEKSRVRIEVWLGAVEEQEAAAAASSNCSSVEKLPVAVRPSFERTVSGRRWHSTFFTNEPVHLEMFVVLSKDYPSRSSPDFSVNSAWLTDRQLTCICEKLDSIWMENERSPILFLWLDWLENDSLNFLGVSSIILSSADADSNAKDVDSRVINGQTTAEDRLTEILKFDMEADIRTFNSSSQTCPICMEEKLGEHFYRLENCWHICCCECLQAYMEMHVQQGTIQYLSCPEEKCKLPIPVNALRQFLSAEQWRRFDELSLSKAIDNITDLDWCPRCEMPCERASDHEISQLAICPYCSFSFCTSCRELWHQGVPCKSLEEKLAELEQSSSKPADDKNAAHAKAYRLKLSLMANKASALTEPPAVPVQSVVNPYKLLMLSQKTMKLTTKPCPGCRARIEKNGGCNKVICTSCGTFMCFSCGKKISGYDHFDAGGCRQYTPVLNPLLVNQPNENVNLAQLEMENLLEVQPELRRKVVACLNCKTQNLKTDQNNHIRCWACRSSFCYLCRQRIVGLLNQHFNVKSKCKQHSDD